MCDVVITSTGRQLQTLGDLIKEGFEVVQADVGSDVALDDAIYCWCFCSFDAVGVISRSPREFDYEVSGTWRERTPADQTA